MKVNLKKMGAIVAGATILASSAAFAGLMFGSTTLVDDNGAPVAKVVLGENSQPIDGVAGGLIANKIVSEAYKSVELSAEVAGSATCTAGEGEAAGTCAISNEKARLEITVPGSQAAGTWTGENLIGDYLNRELLDREGNVAGDSDAEYTMSGSDTSENANPFRDGSGGSIGPSESFFYRIDGSQLSTFADVTIIDDDAGKTYVEMQDLWIAGDNHFDTDPDDVVGQLDFLAYTLKFDGPGGDEIGIPECTDSEDQDYAVCKSGAGDTTIDDATETHRVKIWFLGEEWIISEMNAPTGSDPDPGLAGDGVISENTVYAGGSVKLAKESVSGILNQGESLPVDDLKFQLDDLEAHGDTTSAILSILDANGNILKKDKVNPGETKEFNVAGKTYRFHVYKVAPGYTFGAKWADVAIFAKELELVDGQELNEDEGNNEGYEVALGWKNLDASTGAEDEGNPEEVDALRTIAVYSQDIEEISSSGDEVLEEGDYVSLVSDPEVWKLSYKGLDITSDDMESLKFKLEEDSPKSFSKGLFNDDVGDYVSCELYPPYVHVTTSDSGSVFTAQGGYTNFDDATGPNQLGELTGSTTDLSDDEFYIAMTQDVDELHAPSWFGGPATGVALRSGLWCDFEDDGIGDEDDFGTDADLGDGVLMRISPSSDYFGFVPMWYGAEYDEGATNDLLAVEVQYDDIGDGDHALEGGGLIVVEPAYTAFSGGINSEPVLCSDGAGDDELEDIAGIPGWACVPSGNPGEVWASYLFGIAEKAGEGTSEEFTDYFIFGVDNSEGGTGDFIEATFEFDFWGAGGGTPFMVMSSDDDEVFYGYAGPVEDRYDHSIVDNAFISERGSEFVAKDEDEVEFDMAHKLAKAQWFLAPASSEVSDSSKTVVTLGEGESETVSGVTVKVLEITEDVGACGASGGSVACTADMSGVSAVIMPDNAPTVQAAMPYTGDYGSLVILDTDAVGVNTLVSVGGDRVNSVTADLLQGSAVDWTAERKVVREVVQGSKIVVAGREGADTLEAAQDFVAQVQRV